MVWEDILQCISGRRSIRSFLSNKVEDWKEKKLLEAANAAPSAGNAQSRFFYLVKNTGLRERLSQAAYGQGSIGEAPLVFVVCSDSVRSASRYGERGETLYAIQDATASIQNILLAAHAMGLGSCWVGAFDEEGARDILSIPDTLRPIALIPVGYPNEKPRKSTRRLLTEVSKII